jgi:tetratricopeptide (TPR) repeat protein
MTNGAPHDDHAPVAADVVKRYLQGLNLEQLGRVDEAVRLYEAALSARFDAAGPYDRLIAIYSERARHQDVIRVASSALASVHTHDDKRRWYGAMRDEAARAQARVPATARRKDDDSRRSRP